MNRITSLLAWHYLTGQKKDKSISTMLWICLLGITLGTFALTLIVCVMQGFEKETHKKLQGIHAQIIMDPYEGDLNFQAINTVVKKEFPEVMVAAPNTTQQIIVQPPGHDEGPLAIALKAIDPDLEKDVTILEKKITHSTGSKTLSTTLDNTSILIGHKLARTLQVEPGDELELFFTQEDQVKRKKITLYNATSSIGGIFKTGIEDFDANVAFCSFALLQELFPNSGVTQIALQLAPNSDEQKTITQLTERFGLSVYSWKDLYPALVSALKLETYAMFLILALIALVASMNVISLLFMYITQKKGDIAILTSMGLHSSVIKNVFLCLGIFLTLVGASAGLLLAFISGLILQHYPFITLPDIYYVSHLPVYMHWSTFLLMFVVVLLLSVIALVIPIHKVPKLNIATILRMET